MRWRSSQQTELLELLDTELIEMGSLIEYAIDAACRALVAQDVELARSTIESDAAIDAAEREIESLCMKLLMLRQPDLSDLRRISAALKMITDMARIGDHAADISETVIMMAREPLRNEPVKIREMAHVSTEMLHRSIDAFVRRDVTLAKAVIGDDDRVDDLFRRVKLGLADMIREDAMIGMQALDLLMIAKYFERIADHAVNLGEWVEFSVTGMYKGEKLQC